MAIGVAKMEIFTLTYTVSLSPTQCHTHLHGVTLTYTVSLSPTFCSLVKMCSLDCFTTLVLISYNVFYLVCYNYAEQMFEWLLVQRLHRLKIYATRRQGTLSFENFSCK